MKNYIKLYALLAMALFVGACDDELNIGENNTNATPTTIVPGGDIFFGASAKKKSAEKKDKRTVYGDPFDTNDDNQKDSIELNWLANDRVQIASPQSGGVANGVAEYSVATVTNNVDDYRSSAAKLQLESKAGLQWKNVNPGAQYNFYAVYPSVEQLSKSIPASEKAKCKLTADGKLTGFLPNTQTVTLDTEKSEGYNYVFKPNMDYAYMVAAEEYFIPQLNRNGEPLTENQDVTIDLNFSSMVTALKFTINAGEISIGAKNAAGGKTTKIIVTDLTLFSASGEELCGAFECDFSGPDFKTNNTHTGFNQVTMNLGNEGCELFSTNGSITTTFFMLPVNTNKINGCYTKGDLKLIIHYYVNDVPQTMTATLGVDIPICEMTYINNLTMKSLKTEIITSSWFQALNPNIYVSQVSIPVAANTFANSSYKITDTYRTQQTKKIEDMWNMGVRGFEMVNTSDGKKIGDNATTLGDMVASEAKQSAAGTFIDNVKLLRSKQVQSFTYDNNGKFISGDPLILICTYSATDDGYNPARYVKQLLYSLESLTGTSNQTYNGIELKIDANTFVQLTSNSTVKDVMGKICVIIRPGNDERWATETDAQYDPYDLYGTSIAYPSSNYSKYGFTKALPKLIESGSAWWSRVVLISDWGQDSWDSWHRRFGAGGFYYCATSASNYDALGDRRKCTDKMESYIIGEKTSMPNDAPTAREYYYPYDLVLGANSTTTAYVQDMVRIVQEEEGFTATKTTRAGSGLAGYNTYTHTVTWPASLTEKKNAIDGLFEMSVATKGSTTANDIYINNLSGYFVTSDHEVSWYPAYKLIVYGKTQLTKAEVFPGNSKGGDYKTCAVTLTNHVYNLLSGETLAKGPWGLVMMDYIGSDGNENSQKLVYMIMMNNFRFPLSQKPTE